MINPIVTGSFKNVFIPPSSDGVNNLKYAISKPFTEEQKKEVEQEKEEKSNKLGFKLAKIAVLTGIGVFALTKGLPKGARLKLGNFLEYLENKTASLEKEKITSKTNQIYLATLRNLKSLTQNSKAIFNLAPLKDVLVAKGLEKVPFLDRMGNHVTNLFEKISVKTSKNAYSKTLSSFDTMYLNFDKANAKLPASEVRKIEEKTKKIRELYTENFSEIARNKRLNKIKNSFDGMDEYGNIIKENSIKDKVFEEIYKNPKKFITNKETYQTFISERLAASEKLKFNNEINIPKAKISNDINDNYLTTKKILSNIDSFVEPVDIEATALIKDISGKLKFYKKSLAAGVRLKNILIDGNLSSKLQELESHIKKSELYDAKTKTEVTKSIKNLNSVLLDNKKGEIQEILDIYKLYLSPAEYQKLKEQTYKATKSFDKSVDLESDKLFDKIRDLKIGAAPKDTLSILAALGVTGWYLSKSESKDERASVTLKYGIPAVGAIAIAVYCTVGLVSSGASLLIGLGSGWIMNKIGSVADDMRKKYKEKSIDLTNIKLPNPILATKNKLSNVDKNQKTPTENK